MCSIGPTGPTGAAGSQYPTYDFSVALNSLVPLALTPQILPFQRVISGNADGGFDTASYTYVVPESGNYSFACTATFTCLAGVLRGSSLKLSLIANNTETLKTSTYSFVSASTGTFTLTLTTAFAGFFKARTPVYVSVLSTVPLANAPTALGPTVAGTLPWVTTFTGRSL